MKRLRKTGKVYVENRETEKLQEATLVLDWKDGVVMLELGNKQYKEKFIQSFFKTIRNLDKRLNAEKLRIICNATSIDVWPTAFDHDSSEASTAIRVPHTERIPVYEYSPWNYYATEDEQRAYRKKIMDFRPKIKEYTGKIFVHNTTSKEKIEGLLFIDMNKERVTVKFDQQEYTEPFHEISYFKTIRKLDQQLNKKGYQLICNATSLDVWPYRVGLTKYTPVARRIPTMEIVNIFESASWNKYATENEQMDFVSNHPETSI